MSRRGRDIERAYEERLLEERLDDYLVVRCAHCEWKRQGPLRDVRHAHRNHREQKHPEIKTPKKRTVRASFGVAITQKTVEDNIAAVREQGGHRWDDEVAA